MKHLEEGQRVRVVNTGLLAQRTGTVVAPSVGRLPALVCMDQPVPAKMRLHYGPKPRENLARVYPDQCELVG
jgi:hypothetical protein